MPPDPLINPSSNIQHLPLIYPSYRHSPDPKISSLIMLLEGCKKYMDKKTVLIRCRYFQMYMYIVRLRCTFVDIMCTFMYVCWYNVYVYVRLCTFKVYVWRFKVYVWCTFMALFGAPTPEIVTKLLYFQHTLFCWCCNLFIFHSIFY